MTLKVERADAREWQEEQLAELFSEGFPAFITADRVVKRYIGRVREYFAEFELILVDERDMPVAAGWGVPLRWDGTVDGLPGGYTDALVRAVEGREQGLEPDTLVICGAVVHPSLRGRGLAGETLMALRRTAREAGLGKVVAPVRPTSKEQFPLMPIEDFMRWRRTDDTHVDPWIRTHERLGAQLLAPAPESQIMTGTVAEWKEWTGLDLPLTAEYVIPGGLSVLRLDKAADHGVYREPHVWMRHA
ncbi:GNAT family N-acetyltransferase [Streptomyces sp. NPDC096205]|uniref:GNAT family N-acetyltransferase n=1 Tax=Streptomyces sp. NPDC096205 TaxID=3366081 RepID=UPI003812B7BB